jgi:hypothetical protein
VCCLLFMLDSKEQMHDLNIMKFARFERSPEEASAASSAGLGLNAPAAAAGEGVCLLAVY